MEYYLIISKANIKNKNLSFYYDIKIQLLISTHPILFQYYVNGIKRELQSKKILKRAKEALNVNNLPYFTFHFEFLRKRYEHYK